MMKAYINIKNDSDLHSHQTLNKRKWLMKREGKRCPTHHFSFGERFDETLMKGYCNVCQCVKLSNHQFIGFSPPSSPLWERQHHPCLYAHVLTGNRTGTMARNIIKDWRKEKGNQCPPTSPPTPPQAFGEQKAIAD